MFHVEHVMENINTCPICQSDAISQSFAVKDHMVSGESFNVVSCADCGFQRTSPRPNPIGPYYESDDYLSHNTNKRSLFDRAYHIIRDRAASQKLQFLQKQLSQNTEIPRLLDIGCGIGVFLNEAKKQKWSISGVEISDSARKQAETRLNQPIFKHFDEVPPDAKFDGISLWHVLEHLPNPVETLQKIHTHAEEGAALVLGLPNPESHDAQFYGSDWAAWDVPIHFWHFRKQDVEALANMTGWTLESVHPMKWDSYYVSLLSESFIHGRKRWVPATWRGWLSNLKGGEHNTSSLKYVLRKL